MTLMITLIVMAAIIFLFVGIYYVLGPDESVEDRIAASPSLQQRTGDPGTGARFGQRVDQQLSRGRFGSKLGLDLAQGGVKMTPTEFLTISLVLVVGSILLGWLMTGTLYAGLGLAVLGGLAPRLWLKQRQEKRLKAFQDQLPNVLSLMVGSLRAGYGLAQALRLVAQEMPEPSKSEYGQVTQELALGYTMQQALEHLVERMASDDLSMVATAITVQSEVGGNLGNILDTIAGTIRERVRIKGELRSLTGTQRMTGYMLAAMPFIVGVLITLLNPTYMMPMFTYPWFFIPIGALISMGIGLFIINKMVNIEL